MIKRTEVFNIGFYDAKGMGRLSGSYRQMRYRIAKKVEEDKKILQVTVWPGPYNYDTTAEELKRCEEFEYSNAGLDAAVAYLNQIYTDAFAEN